MSAIRIIRSVRDHAGELAVGTLGGLVLAGAILSASQCSAVSSESHGVAPANATPASAEMDACTWNDVAGQWITRTGALCRGTGEDPVFMPNGTVTDVPDMWADMPHDGRGTDDSSLEWDCRTMGNQFCGYGNYQGAIPGYYGQDHGVNARR